ncbi:oxidoreductase FAD/NAD(P)-binding domain protein [Dehalogenimonas lykanthroporepellens BL-DC-9]|nr:oxidoreductase FAD/NAD(P)-binding domain protein [Dehalogenimonas lykanthroporepellens BL-DC-9]
MWQFDTTFSDIIQRTPNVKSFRFPVSPAEAPFKAGQYFFVTLQVGGEPALHHFTISSSPGDNYLEFTKKITSHPYSLALDAARPGDPVSIKGPAGAFTLPPDDGRLVFLTGGIGITPVRSMLGDIAEGRTEKFEIEVICANERLEDMVFHDELRAMSADLPGLRIHNVLSQPPQNWTGETGRIDKSLIMKLIPDYIDRRFFISGPPSMVISIQEQLAALKIPLDHIMRDSFTGYD